MVKIDFFSRNNAGPSVARRPADVHRVSPGEMSDDFFSLENCGNADQNVFGFFSESV